jgi:hypothetical protein
MSLDEHPVLDRSSGSEAHAPDSQNIRIIAVGASHIKKMVGGLETLNMDILDLSRPGWKADSDSLNELASKFDLYGVSDNNVIVIDILSNSIICGTDARGRPLDPYKSDGTWHVPGHLAFESNPVLKTILAEAATKLFTGRSPKIICISPLPRYVSGKCCGSGDHLKNFGSDDYVSDIEQNLETVDDLLTGWAQAINARSELIHFRMVADSAEAPLTDLTVREGPLWAAGDPVHGSGSYYQEMAALASETIRSAILDDGASVPPAKRLRLESSVVKREGDKRPQSRKTASWSTGTLPPLRGRGGGHFRGRAPFYRGRFSWRGRGKASRGYRGRGRGGH